MISKTRNKIIRIYSDIEHGRHVRRLPARHVWASTQTGFALLLSLVVISIVLSIGLSMLSITLKQLTLSGTIRDSEKALHTATAAAECIKFHRKNPTDGDAFLNDGNNTLPSITCTSIATLASGSSASPPDTSPAGGTVYKYVYKYDWATSGGSCSETSLYHLDARLPAGDISNYTLVDEGLETVSCTDGKVCTVIFSRGFNRPCSEISTSIRTVQREMTIRFTDVIQ